MMLYKRLIRKNVLNPLSLHISGKSFSTNSNQIHHFQESSIGGAVLASAVALGISTAFIVTLFSNDQGTGVIRDENDKTHPKISPDEFRTVRLVKSKLLTKDTKLLRFQLPSDKSLDYKVPSKLYIKAHTFGVDECFPFGKIVERPYTMVSPPNKKGHFDIIVKRYASPGGDMSRFLHALDKYETIQVKGPIYTGPILPCWADKTHIGMVAGGSGITPMLQVVRYALDRNETKKTVKPVVAATDNKEIQQLCDQNDRIWNNKTMSLVVSNKTYDDIIMMKEFERLQHLHPEEFRVFHTLTRKVPNGWTQGTGRVSKESLQKQLPKPGKNTIILVSGPRGFVDHVAGTKEERNQEDPTITKAGGLLGELGYSKDMVHVY